MDDLKITSVEPLEETRISVHIACLTDIMSGTEMGFPF